MVMLLPLANIDMPRVSTGTSSVRPRMRIAGRCSRPAGRWPRRRAPSVTLSIVISDWPASIASRASSSSSSLPPAVITGIIWPVAMIETMSNR